MRGFLLIERARKDLAKPSNAAVVTDDSRGGVACLHSAGYPAAGAVEHHRAVVHFLVV